MSEVLNIMIIDDEIEALQQFLSQIIEEKNLNYRFFIERPLDAIEYVENYHVDCAYLNIRLVQMNGIELARKLLKIRPSLKIVFIMGVALDEQKIREEFQDSLIGFVYKPFDKKILLQTLQQILPSTKSIFFKTFGPFDVFVNDYPIHFLSKKSKELLALILTYQGNELRMEDAIHHLWPNRELDLAKRLYRDSVYKLRQRLVEVGIGELIIFKRGMTQLNLTYPNVSCDYWEYLQKRNNLFMGSFLVLYPWSKETRLRLEQERRKRKVV